MTSKRKSRKSKVVQLHGDNSKILCVLETTNSQEIRNFNKRIQLFLGYWNEFHSSLAFSRTGIMESLQDAIRSKTARDFQFTDWTRIVKYRWTMKPLSAEGSLLADGGGRFNIGEIDGTRFPIFPALYLAENADIAFREVFGPDPKCKGLDALDYSLTKPDSYTCVRVSGQLETVFDLTDPENLGPYVELIKTIKFPKYVETTANLLALDKPRTVKNIRELYKTFFAENWRIYPMQCDIPANSQIFGQIAEAAGVQGIIYPSTKGTGKCLAVYPRNFRNSNSFVALMDPQPEQGEVISRLDTSSWKKLI